MCCCWVAGVQAFGGADRCDVPRCFVQEDGREGVGWQDHPGATGGSPSDRRWTRCGGDPWVHSESHGETEADAGAASTGSEGTHQGSATHEPVEGAHGGTDAGGGTSVHAAAELTGRAVNIRPRESCAVA